MALQHPDDAPEACVHLGNTVFADLGQVDGSSEGWFERAIRLKPISPRRTTTSVTTHK